MRSATSKPILFLFEFPKEIATWSEKKSKTQKAIAIENVKQISKEFVFLTETAMMKSRERRFLRETHSKTVSAIRIQIETEKPKVTWCRRATDFPRQKEKRSAKA